MNALLFAFLEQAVLAAIAAAGFGVVFNVSARVLIFCAAGGAIGRGLRFLLVETDLGMPIAWAMKLPAKAATANPPPAPPADATAPALGDGGTDRVDLRSDLDDLRVDFCGRLATTDEHRPIRLGNRQFALQILQRNRNH